MATYSLGSPMGHGERTVIEGAGWVPGAKDECRKCGAPFDIETDVEDGVESAIVDVPVENKQGNFCSKACEAKAFYEDADDATKKNLRRIYLAALMLQEAISASAIAHFEKWSELDKGYFRDHQGSGISLEGLRALAGDVITTLAPEGDPGITDDSETMLLPQDLRKTLWLLLHCEVSTRKVALLSVDENKDRAFSKDLWEFDRTRKAEELAAAESAMVGLESLQEAV